MAAEEPFDRIWLLLTATEPGACRIAAKPAAIEAGRCRPAFAYRAPAIVEGASLAYLTKPRPVDHDGERRYELGATGHGPAGAQLAERLCQHIRDTDPATLSAMTTANTDPGARADQLRAGLADYVKSWGTFRTPQVEAAFRTVPRHLFLPGVDLDLAYGPNPVVTRRTAEGTSVSSASSPKLVATMLEQLAVQPGQRVLEIGAATGINAALLAELVGPTGTVVTIDLDDDLAAGAAKSRLSPTAQPITTPKPFASPRRAKRQPSGRKP